MPSISHLSGLLPTPFPWGDAAGTLFSGGSLPGTPTLHVALRVASAEHLLPQVASPVCSKAAFLGKALPTRQALEGVVSRKPSLVWRLGSLSRAAAPPALVILQRPFPSVDSLVTKEATLAAEISPALPAPEHSSVLVGLLLGLHPERPLHQALPTLAFRPSSAPGVHPLRPWAPLRLRDRRAAVPFLVGQEEPLLPEALPAGGAGEGPLPAVHPLVREQVLLEAEALPADAAPKGLLPSVDSLVYDEVVLEAEAPAALRAHEGPLPRVLLLLVPQEAQLLGEALPTHRALVLLFLHLAVDHQDVLVPRALLPGGEWEGPVCWRGALVRQGSLVLVPLHGPVVSWGGKNRAGECSQVLGSSRDLHGGGGALTTGCKHNGACRTQHINRLV